MTFWDDLKTAVKRPFAPAGSRPVPLPAQGVYHYQREDGDGRVRLHLRIEADGRGFLSANASRYYHFNATAAYMAYLALQGVGDQQAVASIAHYFNVPHRQAKTDWLSFAAQMNEIIRPDACPICDIQADTVQPFSQKPSAPYRMDLALTYRCNNACLHCYNPKGRAGDELTTAQWKQVLDKVWSLGIAHVVFTGGEPTLRSDLPELIAHAQNLGQITGLNTNGRKLSDPAYVQQLVDAGLDHVQITLESHDEAIHDGMVAHPGAWKQTVAGIQNVLKTRLYVMTNTTMLAGNSSILTDTLDFLAQLGLPTIGLNALIYSGNGANVEGGLDESQLPPLLDLARKKTEQSGQRLIWYTPTQYCHFDPQLLDLGVKGCTAALYNMCIEPDGGVLPCQSYYHPLGNFLTDEWDAIWNHELALRLRERRDLHPACANCVLLSECGGGCPLARLACKQQEPIAIDPLRSEGTERTHVIH